MNIHLNVDMYNLKVMFLCLHNKVITHVENIEFLHRVEFLYAIMTRIIEFDLYD